MDNHAASAVAGVGLLAVRTVFLQAHVYIHQERSGVCKQTAFVVAVVGWGLPHRDCASNSGACAELPPPPWGGAGVGLLAVRSVFLQAHVYSHPP